MMETSQGVCRCNICLQDSELVMNSDEDETGCIAAVRTVAYARQPAEEDPYEQFVKRLSRLNPNVLRERHKLNKKRRAANKSFCSTESESESTESEGEFPTLTQEEKKELFDELMGPWMKPKPKPKQQPNAKPNAKQSEKPSAKPSTKPSAKPSAKPTAKENVKQKPNEKPKEKSKEKPKEKPNEKATEKNQKKPKKETDEQGEEEKVKLFPMEIRQKEIEMARKKFRSMDAILDDLQEFLKVATAEGFQRYYRTVPCRTDHRWAEADIAEVPSSGAYLERCKEIRKENLQLLMKIVHIQRTTGRVDHRNPAKPAIMDRTREKMRLKAKIDEENERLREYVENVKGLLPTVAQLADDWNEKLEFIKENAKYPLIIPGLFEEETISAEDAFRPRIFIEFALKDGNVLGRIILSLFIEMMPQTTMNFVALCEGFPKEENERPEDKYKKSAEKMTPDVIPNLAGSPIHRIFPNLYFEGGDVIKGDGTNGIAAIGPDFYPESLNVPHDSDGTISMTLTPGGLVNSLFAINFRPIEVLKGRRPAFGRVVKGHKLLEIIESYGTKNGKPKQKLLISRCGIVRPKEQSEET